MCRDEVLRRAFVELAETVRIHLSMYETKVESYYTGPTSSSGIEALIQKFPEEAAQMRADIENWTPWYETSPWGEE